VVGKATGYADRAVSARPSYAPGGDKVDHQVALIEVREVLLGDKTLKKTRIGFVPAGPRREALFNVKIDEEGLYFLTPHAEESFFVLPMYYDRRVRNPKADAAFDKDVELTRRCVKLLADPEAGLKAKDAADRFLTASMLIVRYRTRPPAPEGKLKTEAIPAEQSKRILQALAEADWDESRLGGPDPTPNELFFKLGLTEADGWKAPVAETEFPTAAKRWLKDNADKYRIQRWVVGEKKKD
jgi:hypothetical protein